MVQPVLSYTDGSDFPQEYLVVFIVPQMVTAGCPKKIAITAYRVRAEYRSIHVLKDFGILP